MDTGTHLVIGLGLAGLAYVDPIVAADSSAATAVLIGTVIGSQAPDLDGLLRFKGNAYYIKRHRGASHSLPAIAIWSLLLTGLVGLAFPSVPIAHIGMWVLIAVSFHVFTDLFNSYGTQAFRPFTEKWISWNIIHIFDPVIFAGHLIAILLWSVKAAGPETIFPVLYALLGVYYLWRSILHYVLEKNLYKHDIHYMAGDRYTLIPTLYLHHWNVIKRKEDGRFALGELRAGAIRWIDELKCSSHPAAEASKSHPDIASFLYFSNYACADVRSHKWGYEVRWIDVRYRHRKQYPFVAVLHLDSDYQPLGSYVGWRSETRIEKKLPADSY